METNEQKPTHFYPNADRAIGEPNALENTEEKTAERTAGILSGAKLDNAEKKINAVHTFKDDLATETAKGDFSISKIMMASSKREREQTAKEDINADEKKSTSLIIKILLPLFCILIIGISSYIGLRSAKTPQEVSVAKNPNQQLVNGILYSEDSVLINTQGKNRTDILNTLSKDIIDTKIPTGKIKSLIFANQVGTTSSPLNSFAFLNLMAPGAPEILTRNLKDEYVFGYYSYDSNEPFIILKAANYDSAFAGMLDWEKSMYADLEDFIFRKESLNGSKSSTSTTTASTTAIERNEYDTDFVDKIISNNDVRILYRPNGNIAFFYTFFNKDTIIIATSEQTLKEVIYRLTSGKITR